MTTGNCHAGGVAWVGECVRTQLPFDESRARSGRPRIQKIESVFLPERGYAGCSFGAKVDGGKPVDSGRQGSIRDQRLGLRPEMIDTLFLGSIDAVIGGLRVTAFSSAVFDRRMASVGERIRRIQGQGDLAKLGGPELEADAKGKLPSRQNVLAVPILKHPDSFGEVRATTSSIPQLLTFWTFKTKEGNQVSL